MNTKLILGSAGAGFLVGGPVGAIVGAGAGAYLGRDKATGGSSQVNVGPGGPPPGYGPGGINKVIMSDDGSPTGIDFTPPNGGQTANLLHVTGPMVGPGGHVRPAGLGLPKNNMARYGRYGDGVDVGIGVGAFLLYAAIFVGGWYFLVKGGPKG